MTSHPPGQPTDPVAEFAVDVDRHIAGLRADADLQAASRLWVRNIAPHKYSYNFRWMGRPIIQFPQDMVAMQELIWAIRPDLVIETGIAHGGSILYYASLLELAGHGEVLGIDVDIRAHNRSAIEAHPMAHRVRMIQGSSIDPEVITQVQALAQGRKVLLTLDSNHTHEHVLAELRAYAPLVSVGSYCVVMDTIVEDLPASLYPDRPWGPGNSPKTAVRQFLTEHGGFEIDHDIEAKLLITVAPSGWLRRVGCSSPQHNSSQVGTEAHRNTPETKPQGQMP
jgi:cephalosporin hydroxylase